MDGINPSSSLAWRFVKAPTHLVASGGIAIDAYRPRNHNLLTVKIPPEPNGSIVQKVNIRITTRLW
jgi:hypothetical protein